jgi:hypothetical protein
VPAYDTRPSPLSYDAADAPPFWLVAARLLGATLAVVGLVYGFLRLAKRFGWEKVLAARWTPQPAADRAAFRRGRRPQRLAEDTPSAAAATPDPATRTAGSRTVSAAASARPRRRSRRPRQGHPESRLPARPPVRNAAGPSARRTSWRGLEEARRRQEPPATPAAANDAAADAAAVGTAEPAPDAAGEAEADGFVPLTDLFVPLKGVDEKADKSTGTSGDGPDRPAEAAFASTPDDDQIPETSLEDALRNGRKRGPSFR